MTLALPAQPWRSSPSAKQNLGYAGPTHHAVVLIDVDTQGHHELPSDSATGELLCGDDSASRTAFTEFGRLDPSLCSGWLLKQRRGDPTPPMIRSELGAISTDCDYRGKSAIARVIAARANCSCTPGQMASATLGRSNSDVGIS